MYSNGYIFRYAAILVIITAALLSMAAMLLKPFQERNRAIDKMQGILASAGLRDVEADNAISLFNKNIVEEEIISPQGEIIDTYKGSPKEDGPAFKVNLKTENYNKSKGKPYKLPLYIANVNGKKIYIIPMRGTGLWGPIWGNIALSEDFKTVDGVFFDHEGETPGLGAEITTDQFQKQFIGKSIFDENGKFTSIQVVKGGIKALPAAEQKHGVDAISGGTITSKGVEKMLNETLKSYLPYIKKHS